jgi:hypothetical protein
MHLLLRHYWAEQVFLNPAWCNKRRNYIHHYKHITLLESQNYYFCAACKSILSDNGKLNGNMRILVCFPPKHNDILNILATLRNSSSEWLKSVDKLIVFHNVGSRQTERHLLQTWAMPTVTSEMSSKRKMLTKICSFISSHLRTPCPMRFMIQKIKWYIKIWHAYVN